MNETLVYKKYISHFILEKGPQLVDSREIDGETYTQREDFFFPYLLPGARGYQRLHLLASSSETPLTDCVSHARLRFSALCLKSDNVVLITLFPSGYSPVVPDCPEVLSYPCLLITAWQLIKAHGVTRNEPKIHNMLYNIIKIVQTTDFLVFKSTNVIIGNDKHYSCRENIVIY